jgi:parallel beta-helix repeat protein
VDTDTATTSTMTIAGTLSFARGQFSSMTVVGGSVTVNASGFLDLGTEADPLGEDTTAHLVLAYGYGSSERYGLVVKNGGKFSVRGATKSPYGFSLTDMSGAVTIFDIAASSSVGWKIGDTITIGPTSTNGPGESHEAVILDISNGQRRTVTFSPGTSGRSLTEATPIVVTNLTRNVVVRSSGTDTAGAGNTAYIENLSQTEDNFRVRYGEFAFLGANTVDSQFGISFNGSPVRGSISSSTIRGGYFGIFLKSSPNNTLSHNVVYGGTNGIQFFGGADNTDFIENVVHGNTGYHAYINGADNVRVEGNFMFAGGAHGINVIGVDTYASVINNRIYSNSLAAIRMVNTNDNVIAQNALYENGTNGIYVENSSTNTFIGNAVYSNANPGFAHNGGINNIFADGWLGYDFGGNSRPNSVYEVQTYAGDSPEGLVLKGTPLNGGGIDTAGLDQEGAYIVSYEHNGQLGTMRVFGDYEISVGSITLDYSQPTYNASYTQQRLVRGSGHSLLLCTLSGANVVCCSVRSAVPT